MDLWLSGEDDRIVCPEHIGPELRAGLDNLPKGRFKVRTESEGWWTRISPTLAVLDALACEECGAAPTDAGLGDGPVAAIDWSLGADPQWRRVAFPAGWVDDVAWPWIAQVGHGMARAGGWSDSDTEASMRSSWREQEDGTLLYRDDLNRFRLELVTAPAFGCWLRLLSVPVLPGVRGSVQKETQELVVCAQGGLDDPATIVRTLFHFAFPIFIEGFECAGPIGEEDLKPAGPFDVHAADGDVLANGVDDKAALAVLHELAGSDGTVHVLRSGMKAFRRMPDPTGAPWDDHGHGRMVGYTSPAA